VKTLAEKKAIAPSNAPAPKGPYSPGILCGGFVFVAGQGPIDPDTGEFVLGDIREETERTLRNIQAILESAGATMADVVKVSVFLKDLNDFQAMNEVYARWFPDPKPARTTVQAGLGGGMKVEIDVIAKLPEK
jgi:2-iminobutanoate/2-iminopropanoate deaminase